MCYAGNAITPQLEVKRGGGPGVNRSKILQDSWIVRSTLFFDLWTRG